MKKSVLINVVLLLLIIGLYWSINQEPTKVENKNLSALRAEQVNSINIKRHNRDDIVLNKQGKHWFITQPIQASANTMRVNLILDLLSCRSHGQLKSDSNLALQQFDLAPANIILHVNDQRFEFGNIEPLSKYRYIRYNNLIHLVNDTVAPLLNSNPASFIDNRLFSKELSITKISLPEIVNEEIQSSALSISLKDGHWQTSDATLSADQLTALVSAWKNAYAMQVLPITLAKIQKAIGQDILLTFSDQTTTKFLLQFNSRSMSLIDPDKKLKYQFPLSSTQQFFPVQDSSH